VPQGEIDARLASYRPKPRHFERGYVRLHATHVQQADQGCDYDFLEGDVALPEPEIH